MRWCGTRSLALKGLRLQFPTRFSALTFHPPPHHDSNYMYSSQYRPLYDVPTLCVSFFASRRKMLAEFITELQPWYCYRNIRTGKAKFNT